MIKLVARILTSTFIVLGVVVPVSGATITRDDASLTYAATTDAGSFEVTFRNCMANNLFTFHTVKLNGKTVNSAQHSDNIGPFLLVGHGWAGGNHLSDSGNATARTVNVAVNIDGQNFSSGTHEGSVAEVTVTNELLMPDSTVFAVETMRYIVAGNSIEVLAEHQYRISTPVVVERYYGMQSMFEGETAILAPGSLQFPGWISLPGGHHSKAIKIKQSDAPSLSAFVEKSADSYQAAFMFPEHLGSRSNIQADDVVFIGNSYGKCYHKLMGNTTVHPGDTTHWHGVYSWFTEPIKDTFGHGASNPELTYPAYIGGNPASITIDGTGRASIIPNDITLKQ